MTLPEDLALAYVRELSADYRSGAVLDASGALLAGDEALARAARGLPPGGPSAFEGSTDRGKVFAARTATHLLIVTTGPFALPGLVHRDLATALAAMGVETAQETPLQRIPHAAVEALLRAPE